MVLRGISKRVIVIKNPDSDIFEEAYFIVKSGKGLFRTPKENDMVNEANRLITEYHRQQRKSSKDSVMYKTNGDTAPIPKETVSAKESTGDVTAQKEKAAKRGITPEDAYYDDIISGINTTVHEESGIHAENAEGLRKDIKTAFRFLSAKKASGFFKNLNISPRSFIYGIGCMSAVVVIFKIVEAML